MKIRKCETSLMFNEIAGSYDSMNNILSLGLDKLWRKKFVKNLKNREYEVVADIASGTGELLNNLAILNADKYYAIDPSVKMLALADSKICDADFINAYAENLPLEDNSIDLATVSFGIRNFSDINKAFSEIYRILAKDGVFSIMEFSLPKFFLFRWGFYAYIKLIIPLIVKLFSKDKHAYNYLVESILDFGKNVDVVKLLESEGFSDIHKKNLTFGAVIIYTCRKV